MSRSSSHFSAPAFYRRSHWLTSVSVFSTLISTGGSVITPCSRPNTATSSGCEWCRTSPWFLGYSLAQRHDHRFPIREYGLNYSAQPLQKHEIKTMTKDETIIRRIVTSYKLMLDFYGMRLEDEATGLVSRSKNHAAQYRNLCSTSVSRLCLVLQSTLRS